MPPASATLGQSDRARSLRTQSIQSQPFCDDFSTFDQSRWNTYSTPGYWGYYNTAGTYEAANTSVKDGLLILKTEHVSGDVSSLTEPAVYRSAVVQSLDRMGYGTYDIWVKLSNASVDPAAPGVRDDGTLTSLNNYFELDYTDANTSPDTLIESKYGYGLPTDLLLSTYKTGVAPQTIPVTTAQNLSQGFRHHRWEWTPNALKLFIDGQLVHAVTDPAQIPSEAAQFFFNAWPVNKPDWNMPGSSAARYTMVDKFCYTPPSTNEEIVSAPVVIDTSMTPPTASVGSEVFFSSEGYSGENFRYQWDFGDGTIELSEPDSSGGIVHTYDAPGYYTVRMTAVGLETQQSHTSSIPIAVLPKPEQLVSSQIVKYGQSLTLDVKYPVPGLIYEWKVGENHPLIGARVSPQLTSPGLQDVTLTIYKDSDGIKKQDIDVETISKEEVIVRFKTYINYAAPQPKAVIQSLDPIADHFTNPQIFYYRPNSSVLRTNGSDTVSVSARQSSISNEGATYLWDFGDGTRSSGVDAVHTYQKDGRYPLTLTVTDQFGQISKAYKIVIVDTVSSKYPLAAVTISADDDYTYYPPLPIGGCSTCADSLKTGSLNSSKNTKYDSIATSVFGEMATLNYGYPYVIAEGLADKGFVSAYFGPSGEPFHIGVAVTYDTDSNIPNHSINFNGRQILQEPNYKTYSIGAVNFWDGHRDSNYGNAAIEVFPQFYKDHLTSGVNITTLKASRVEYSIDIAAFDSLRVPHVLISILPNSLLSNIETREYSFNNNGIDEMLLQVNVPEDSITSTGEIEFSIPVYAVDEKGRALTQVSGIFNAYFQDNRVKSHSKDGVMINGRSEVVVKIPIGTPADVSVQFDPTKMRLKYSDAEECVRTNWNNWNKPDYFMRDRADGCHDIVATHRTPIFTVDLGNLGTQNLKPLTSASDFFEIQKSRFASLELIKLLLQDTNRVVYGRTVEERKIIDDALDGYDASTAKSIIQMLPMVGDLSTILIYAYEEGIYQTGDPVEYTLAALGLAMDLSSGGTGLADFTTGLKILYTSGGATSKSLIRAMIDDIRASGMNPSRAYQSMKSYVGFMSSIGWNRALMPTVDDALSVSKASGGNYSQVFSRFNASFQKFKFSPKLSIFHKIKVAKYDMYAPEIARVLGKCGEECINYIGESVNLAADRKSDIVNVIKEAEEIYKSVSKNSFGQKIKIYTTALEIASDACATKSKEISQLQLKKRAVSICATSLLNHILKPEININKQSIIGGHTVHAIEGVKRFLGLSESAVRYVTERGVLVAYIKIPGWHADVRKSLMPQLPDAQMDIYMEALLSFATKRKYDEPKDIVFSLKGFDAIVYTVRPGLAGGEPTIFPLHKVGQ